MCTYVYMCTSTNMVVNTSEVLCLVEAVEDKNKPEAICK